MEISLGNLHVYIYTFYTYMYVIFFESRYPIVCHLHSVSITITNLKLLFCYPRKISWRQEENLKE